MVIPTNHKVNGESAFSAEEKLINVEEPRTKEVGSGKRQGGISFDPKRGNENPPLF